MGTHGPQQDGHTATSEVPRQPADSATDNAPHRSPIDPWCDDGSISRVEPPWLRDKRLQQQRDRLQQQKERLQRNKSPPAISPASTNPFDSSSVCLSYSDSSQNSASFRSALHRANATSTQPVDHRPVTPIGTKMETGATLLRKQQQNIWEQPVPPYQSFPKQQRTNPFDSNSLNTGSSQDSHPVNPFDTSGDSSTLEPQTPQAPQAQFIVKQRPQIARPTAKRPMMNKNPQKLMYADETSAEGDDSLDRFLDTTDETAVSSGREDDDEEEQRQYLQPHQPQSLLGPYFVSGTTSSEASESVRTNPSERALQAAQFLRESFGRSKSRQSTESGYAASSTSGQQTPITHTSSSTQPQNTPKTHDGIVTSDSMHSPDTSSHPQGHHYHPVSNNSTNINNNMDPKSPRSPITPGESVRPANTRLNLTASSLPMKRQPRSPQDFPSLQSTKNRNVASPYDALPDLPAENSMPPSEMNSNEINFGLHDLCDEARTTDDLAWRNALFLLSVQPELASQQEPECQMNALHVCCMTLDAQQPPPVWMIRALLYTEPQQCQQEDSGGRLPLHLLAATSGNVELMHLLVEEYPASVAHTDSRGFTPLHLLLKNEQVPLTLEHLRVLLGQTTQNQMTASSAKKGRISFRKGEHLKQSFQDLQDLHTQQQEKHEQLFDEYPEDVQQALRKITQWKRRQVNRGVFRLPHNNSNRLALVYHNPASIATPTSQQLPLHLLVRRKHPSLPISDIRSHKLATKETLIRVLIAAHPPALLEKDVHGRTPLLVALLQSDSLPDVETVDLLLGKYTPGICSDLTQSPAQMAASDTLQLPLHVAAEELAHNFELLSTIVEAYPAAVQVQDIRGRTPLHCALRNYRSVPVDEATFGLLLMSRNHNYEKVSKTMDDDGKRPLDLIIEQPKVLIRWSTEDDVSDNELLCAFLSASMDPPRSAWEARTLLERIRTLPPWLRRAACASSHIQRTLLEELANPMNTLLVLLQGVTLLSLLIVLRLALEGTGIEYDSWVLVYFFCAYHLVTQIVYWGTACFLGEFYRMVFSNGWRWIDFAAVCFSMGTAAAIHTDITSLRASLETYLGNFSSFIPAEDDAVISALGAWATGLLWLSLVGFLVQWWCAMAVFVGAAVQVVRTLFWPFALGAMGIVAMSQILNTLEDCAEGNICGLQDAYTTVYWMILGEPILGLGELSVFENETTTSMVVLLIFFTLLWLIWIASVIAMIVSEAYRLDRHQLALQWFWEPKVVLTVMARPDNKESYGEPSTWTEQYCDFMARLWHVLASSIRGGNQKHEACWYAYALRPGVIMLTRLLACIILPLWFWLGVATMGLLWPPQIRSWLFSTKIVDYHGKKKSTGGPTEERLTAAKLSHFKGEMEEHQFKSMEQNHVIQQDLAQIKDLLFRAMAADEGSPSGSW